MASLSSTSLESGPSGYSTTSSVFAQNTIAAVHARPAGSVIVFGSGDCGQLGLGEDLVSAPRPKRHPFFEDKEIVSVAAGGLHTLALSRSGRVYSWGCNDEKALGHVAAEFSAAQVHGLDDKFIIQVTCGDSISAALTSEGKIYTWGTFRDSSGVIGVRSKQVTEGTDKKKSMKSPLKKTKLTASATSLASVASTSMSSSSVSDAHGMEISSLPATSELDHQEPEEKLNLDNFHLIPTLLKELSHLRVKRISAGANHLLALTDDGDVYAWGSGERGQLARRISSRNKLYALNPTCITPRRHRSHGGIIGITCGSYHSFLLASDGTVFAVGLNNYGQLGFGDFEDRLAAEAIPVETWQGHRVVDLVAGEHHSTALSASGAIFVFGRGDFGQLGLGSEGVMKQNSNPLDSFTLPTPQLNSHLFGINAIASGSNHLLATAGDRKRIFSWGYGEMGQLGHEEEEDELKPRRIEAFSDQTTFLDVSAGGQHSVVLMTKKL